jgi:heme exporter protein C
MQNITIDGPRRTGHPESAERNGRIRTPVEAGPKRLAAGRYLSTRLLGYGSLALLAVSTFGLFFLARPDRVQGDAARIIYFHVPMAWVAFLAFFVVFVASVAYLRTRSARWDRLGRASAEVGVVFTTLVLITGAIWGHPIWGTWWSWDPKLTTTLILWFIYLAYLMVRGYAEPPRGPAYAAILGIIGFVDVPIVYQASVWWRTLHPSPVLGPAAQQQSTDVVWLLLFSLAAFTAFFVFLTRVRMRIEELGEALDGPADAPHYIPESLDAKS